MSSETIKQKLINHLDIIYPDECQEELAEKIIETFWPKSGGTKAKENHLPSGDTWSENTTLLITYGDTIIKKNEIPLQTLHNFLKNELQDIIHAVHILPFFSL